MSYFAGNKREIGMVVLLSIVTCGIYALYWMYDTTKLLADFNEDYQTNPGLVVIFTIITCGLYGIYWWYKIAQMFITSQQIAQMDYISDNSVLFLILAIFQFSIIGMAILQSDLNKFWDALD